MSRTKRYRRDFARVKPFLFGKDDFKESPPVKKHPHSHNPEKITARINARILSGVIRGLYTSGITKAWRHYTVSAVRRRENHNLRKCLRNSNWESHSAITKVTGWGRGY